MAESLRGGNGLSSLDTSEGELQSRVSCLAMKASNNVHMANSCEVDLYIDPGTQTITIIVTVILDMFVCECFVC